jgi:hypothetical protein
MEATICERLSHLELGPVQQHHNLAVFPLFTPSKDSLTYLTLKQALDAHLLTIAEVSEGGSVPQLKVVNQADLPVLLLDGEELAGAKQNRILNATILIREKWETIIPVSCTEHGRWSYVTPHFEDSGVVASRRVRRDKSSSVSYSLNLSGTYQSDQGEVWDNIAAMSLKSGVHTRTGAMKDVYESRADDLDAYLTAAALMPGQKGLLAMINGEVAGFDLVSLESAWQLLHAKLVKSYAMDALLERTEKASEATKDKAEGFLKAVLTAEEKNYPSVGYGQDYRYQGHNLVESALLHEECVIHAAFFQASASERVENMTSSRSRRRYRI